MPQAAIWLESRTLRIPRAISTVALLFFKKQRPFLTQAVSDANRTLAHTHHQSLKNQPSSVGFFSPESCQNPPFSWVRSECYGLRLRNNWPVRRLGLSPSVHSLLPLPTATHVISRVSHGQTCTKHLPSGRASSHAWRCGFSWVGHVRWASAGRMVTYEPAVQTGQSAERC